MKVKNKSIVVTGGGSGMGLELVLGLLAKGARVAAIDINAAALEKTIELAGSNRPFLSTHVVDITDKKSVEAVTQDIIRLWGAVDGLINNAGIIQPFVRLNDLPYETIDRVMNVNLFGTLYLTKSFLPHLLTRPEAHIVNISSMGGFLPVPGQTIYGAAKAAVKLMTEGLTSELADTNVRVSVVFPGAVRTGIMENSGLKQAPASASGHNSNKVLSAATAAQIILEGMDNDRSRIMVGKDARIMDLLYRWNPKSAARLIYNKMKAKLA